MIEKMLTVTIKNTSQPIHWHDLLEINFVLRGTMEVTRNNKTFQVSAGEIMVLNRDDVHSITSTDDILYAQIHLDLERFNQYIPDIWTVIFYCSPEEQDVISKNLKAEIKDHITRIIDLIDSPDNNIDTEQKLIYHCIEILSDLKMGFMATMQGDSIKNNQEQSDRIWKVIDYMYDNYNRKLSLHEVAQLIYVSDDYLSRLMKKMLGRTFEGMLSFIRAESSIRYLLNSDMSISAISSECGFSAPKYYTAAFQKVYGCTPGQYRENNRANFLLEKQKQSQGIAYDDGVDLTDLPGLMKRYEIIYSSSGNVRKTVSVDYQDIVIRKKEMTWQADSFPRIRKNSIWRSIQRNILSEIPSNCAMPEQNIFLWRDNDAIKMVLFNPDLLSSVEYMIHFSGLEKNRNYIYCREKTPKIPDRLKKLIEADRMEAIHADISKASTSMTSEIGEICGDTDFYMEVELAPEQIAKIVLQST